MGKLTLSKEERRAILRGDHTALKRTERPDVRRGQTMVLRWSRGGKQFIERSEEGRRAAAQTGTALTIDIPRKPTVWLEFADPQHHGDEWRVSFTVHDEREPTRLLAGPPNPPGTGALKTRALPPEKARERRTDRSWTTESERGYGGGKSAVDDRESVDDATLEAFARRVEEENCLRRNLKRDMSAKLRQEAGLLEEYRKRGGSARRRRAERASKRAENLSDEAA